MLFLPNLTQLSIDAKRKRGPSICSICTQSMRGGTRTLRPCEHRFHLRCIKPWLRDHDTCPNCRTAVDAEQLEGFREPDPDNVPEVSFETWRLDLLARYHRRELVVMYYLQMGAIPVPTPGVADGFIGIAPHRESVGGHLEEPFTPHAFVHSLASGSLGRPTPRSFKLAFPPDDPEGLSGGDAYRLAFKVVTSPLGTWTTYLEGLTDTPVRTMRLETNNPDQLREHSPNPLRNVSQNDLRRGAAFAFLLCEDVDVFMDPLRWPITRPNSHPILGPAYGFAPRFSHLMDPNYGPPEPGDDTIVAVPPNVPGNQILIIRVTYYQLNRSWQLYLSPSLVQAHGELLGAHLALSWPPDAARALSHTEINAIPRDVYSALPGATSTAP